MLPISCVRQVQCYATKPLEQLTDGGRHQRAMCTAKVGWRRGRGMPAGQSWLWENIRRSTFPRLTIIVYIQHLFMVRQGTGQALYIISFELKPAFHSNCRSSFALTSSGQLHNCCPLIQPNLDGCRQNKLSHSAKYLPFDFSVELRNATLQLLHTKVGTHKRAEASWTCVCCSLAWGVISAEPPILISISLGLIPFLIKVFYRLGRLDIPEIII